MRLFEYNFPCCPPGSINFVSSEIALSWLGPKSEVIALGLNGFRALISIILNHNLVRPDLIRGFLELAGFYSGQFFLDSPFQRWEAIG